MKKEFDQDALLTQAEISEKKRREELNDIAINNEEASIELSEQELAVEDVVADAGAIATDASIAAEATTGAAGISTTALVGGGLAAIGAGLALSGGSSDSNNEAELEAKEPAEKEPEAAKPVDESRTVTAEEVSAFINQNSEDKPFSIAFAEAGNNTLVLNNGAVAPEKGFVVSSAGDLTINTLGTASGKIFVSTTKSVIANLQSTSDIDVTTGFGDDTIVLAPNSLGAGDVINGGAGNDVLEISGDIENIIGGEQGAVVENIETIKLNSVLIFADAKDLDGLTIIGDGTASKVIVISDFDQVIDLTESDISGLVELSIEAEDSVTIELDEALVAGIDALKVSDETDNAQAQVNIVGSAAAIKSLVSEDKFDSELAAELNISDTPENIQALLADQEFARTVAEAGINIGAGTISVADAVKLVVGGSTIEFDLKDSAEALALAPATIFGTEESPVDVFVDASATVAQANAIAGKLAESAELDISLEDTASNLANYSAELVANSVVVTDTASVAEAQNIAELVEDGEDLTITIRDKSSEFVESDKVIEISGVDRVELTDEEPLSLGDIELIVDFYGDAVVGGYIVTGTFDDYATENTDLDALASASKVIVEDAITAQKAKTIVALEGASKEFTIEDTVEGFLLSANSVVSAATAVVFAGNETPDAALVNKLFGLVGTKLSSAEVVDGIAELATLSTAALGSVESLAIETGSSSNIATYNTLLVNIAGLAKGVEVTFAGGGEIKDTAAALLSDSAENVIAKAASIVVTGTTSFADAAALMPVLELAGLADKVTFEAIAGDFAQLADTVVSANLEAAFNKAQSIDAKNATVDTIPTSSVKNASISYDLTDTAENLFVASDALLDNARNIKVTGTASVAQADTILAANNDVVVDADGNPVLKDDETQPNGNTTEFSLADDISGFVAAEPGLTQAEIDAVVSAATSVSVESDLGDLLGAAEAVAAIAKLANSDIVATSTAAALETAIDSEEKSVADVLAAIDSFDLDNVILANSVESKDDIATLTKIIDSGLNTEIELTITFDVFQNPSEDINGSGDVLKAATKVTVSNLGFDDDGNQIPLPLSLAQYASIDSQLQTVIANIDDTLANILKASDSLLAKVGEISFNNNPASEVTVAQAQRLQSLDVKEFGTLEIADTAANILAIEPVEGVRPLLVDFASVSLTDKGALDDLSFADATVLFGDEEPFYTEYSITDTAENISDTDVAKAASLITVTDTVDVAAAAKLAAIETRGSVQFSVEGELSDSFDASALAQATSVNLVKMDATQVLTQAQIAELSAESDFDFATATYAVEFEAAEVFAGESGEQVIASAFTAALVNAESVSFDSGLTVEQVQLLAAADVLSVATFGLVDTAAAIAEAPSSVVAGASTVAFGETADAATFAQAASIVAKAASDAMLNVAISDKAENFDLVSDKALEVASSITLTGALSAQQAARLVEARSEADKVTETDFVIEGTAAELQAVSANVLAAAQSVVVTDAAPVSLLLTATVMFATGYSIKDTFTNIMDDDTADENATTVAASGLFADAASVEVIGALTLAQLDLLSGAIGDSGKAITYSIQDSDSAIKAASKGEFEALTEASSVIGFAGTELEFEVLEVGDKDLLFLTGTKFELLSLSEELQSIGLIFETNVSELNTDIDFFANLDGDQFSITDSLAALKDGSIILNRAVEITVTDSIKVADIKFVEEINGSATTVYNLVDSAANLTAESVDLTGAATVTASTAATLDQAIVLNAAKADYSIADIAGEFVLPAGDEAEDVFDAALDSAQNITVTLAEGETSVTAATATLVLAAENAGVTSIPAVAATSADLADLLAALDASDTVASVTVAGDLAVGAATEDAEATAATALLNAVNAGQIDTVSYSLSDTAAALFAAPASLLNGATAIEATDRVTLEQAARLDTASGSKVTPVYSLIETAENILAKSNTPEVLAKGENENNFIVVDDTKGITAGQATALRKLDADNDTAAGFRIGTLGATDTDELQGQFDLVDSIANLLAAANAEAVNASTGILVSGTASVKQIDALPELLVEIEYSLADKVAELFNGAKLNAIAEGAEAIEVAEAVTVAQAKELVGKVELLQIVDSAAAVAAEFDADNKALIAKSSFVLNTAANLVEADILAETGIAYSIVDTATALFEKFNSVGRDLLVNATAITVAEGTALTVADALGSADTGAGAGLYNLSNLTFDVADTVSALETGLQSLDSAGLSAATVVTATADAGAADLTALDELRGDLVITVAGDTVADNFVLGNGKDIVQLDTLDGGVTDTVTKFDAADDTIDLVFVDKLDTLVAGKTDATVGNLADNKKLVDGLTLIDLVVTKDSDDAEGEDTAITEDDIAAVLDGVELSAAEDVVYLAINADTGEAGQDSVLLVKVTSDDSNSTIEAEEITQLAVITSADIDGLEVADLSANNFTDFTV